MQSTAEATLTTSPDPGDTTGTDVIALTVRGSYPVEWAERSGNSGTIEYTFRSDGRVLKAVLPSRKLEQCRGKWIINYDEDQCG